MGVPQAGLRLNMWCSLGILVVITVLGAGLPALDRAVSGTRQLTPGVPYRVTDAVSVVPPAGATLDAGQSRPGRDSGQVLFNVGGVRFVVLVSQDELTLGTATDRLLARLRDSVGARTTSAAHGVAGVPADLISSGRFRSDRLDGWYAVRVFAPRTVVDVTASGSAAALTERLPAIQTAVASIGPR
jgi:hypothetical protein